MITLKKLYEMNMVTLCSTFMDKSSGETDPLTNCFYILGLRLRRKTGSGGRECRLLEVTTFFLELTDHLYTQGLIRLPQELICISFVYY